MPATDEIHVMKMPNGDIERGKTRHRDGTVEHTLFLPPFESYQEMEKELLDVTRIYEEEVSFPQWKVHHSFPNAFGYEIPC